MTDPTTLIPGMPLTPLSFHGAGITHVGRVRQSNEDSILTDPTGILWAVADGMGGHGHGDTASEIVIDHLSEMPDEGNAAEQIDTLLASSNQAILAHAASLGVDQIGSTVVVLKLDARTGHFAWAGDSRGYLLRGEKLRQITQDHTVVEELVRDGLIDRDSAKNHASANVVTRAVGADITLEIEHASVPLVAGDRLLLCSDGLTVCLDDTTIESNIYNTDDPDTACRRLLAAALESGAPDNVSVIVVFVEDR